MEKDFARTVPQVFFKNADNHVGHEGIFAEAPEGGIWKGGTMRFVIPKGKYRKLTRILTHLDCEIAVCGSILGKLFRAGFLEESEYEKLRNNRLLDECGAYEEMAIEEQVSKDIQWKGKPVKFYYDEGAGPTRY